MKDICYNIPDAPNKGYHTSNTKGILDNIPTNNKFIYLIKYNNKGTLNKIVSLFKILGF